MEADGHEMGQAHADGTRQKAASGEHAAIGRGTRSSWPAVTAEAINTGVLIMMMFTTKHTEQVERKEKMELKKE